MTALLNCAPEDKESLRHGPINLNLEQASNTDNIWSKINVLSANSVHFLTHHR